MLRAYEREVDEFAAVAPTRERSLLEQPVETAREADAADDRADGDQGTRKVRRRALARVIVLASTLSFVNGPEASDTMRADQPAGFDRYDKRIEELVEAFSDQVERAGGKALEEFAAIAKRLAVRLEDVAEQARRRREQETGE